MPQYTKICNIWILYKSLTGEENGFKERATIGIRSIYYIPHNNREGDDFNLKLGEMSGDRLGNDQHPLTLHWDIQNKESVLNHQRGGKGIRSF